MFVSRLELKFALLLLFLTIARAAKRSATGIGVAWDITPADRADYHPVSQLGWYSSRLDDSPFEIRTISGTGTLSSKKSAVLSTDSTDKSTKRRRRDVEANDKTEKKSREARTMSSPSNSWTNKPLVTPSLPFRHRFDEYVGYEDGEESGEAANLPPLIRAHYAPKTDFITSGRSRALGPPPLMEARYPEGRESRDLSVARAYDDYDVPLFRNVVREHDFDVQLPRTYYYPNRYRTQVFKIFLIYYNILECLDR